MQRLLQLGIQLQRLLVKASNCPVWRTHEMELHTSMDLDFFGAEGSCTLESPSLGLKLVGFMIPQQMIRNLTVRFGQKHNNVLHIRSRSL